MKKLIIYARVSGEAQRDNTSLGDQVERCKAWCLAYGYEVAEVVQEVMSGKNIDDRMKMNAVIESVFAGRADGMCVLKLDRLSRNVVDIVTLANRFQAADKVMSIVELQVDTSTPNGMFALTIMGAVAELERLTIRDRCNAGRAAAKAAGRRIGGGATYGYTLDGEEIPEQQRVIQRMRELKAEGLPLRSIADALNAEGLPTMKGGMWQAMTVRNILSR